MQLATYRTAIDNLGVAGLFQRRRARRTAVGSTQVISTRWSDHPLHVRGGTSDMAVFDQIFMEREYRCLDGLSDIRTIVDAGANVGYSSAYLLTRFPDAQVICLEPDRENFDALTRNLAPFGSRVKAVNAALWSEPCALDFKSDTLGVGAEWGREVEQSTAGNVDALDMPAVIERAGYDSIDLLKVDIEGAELQVFSAHDLGWLANVRNIVTELHSTECKDVFFRAIGDRYDVTECGELTVCLGRST